MGDRSSGLNPWSVVRSPKSPLSVMGSWIFDVASWMLAARRNTPRRAFRIAPTPCSPWLGAVSAVDLTPAQQAVVLSLLDDPSPVVRRGLRDHVQALGAPAVVFLRRLAQSPRPATARHARDLLQDLRVADPVGEFHNFIRSLHYELETGSLLLARTVRPDLDTAACGARLDALAADCRQLMVEPASAREKCRVINRVLFHDHGFRGNSLHYTDPDNSHLDQVLARRRGIPLALSLVYLFVARRLGLELEPVGLPGHFMVGCYLDETPFFIDPFEGGLLRSPAEVFLFLRQRQLAPTLADLTPTPVREVLCRACRNLAHHYTAAHDPDHAALFAGFVTAFEATLESQYQ
jgi:regulator of sirC expression with transglutaminase-like and TPR domain